jgi:trehalose 6-phosphate synthase
VILIPVMGRTAKFLIVLVAGLALLTVAGYALLTGMMRGWFEDDMATRARVAVAAATDSFDSGIWPDGRPRIKEALTRITRDERIMGAAACSPRGELLAATDGYPTEFACRALLTRMRAEDPAAPSWSMSSELPSGRVHITVTTLASSEQPVGSVVLVHDLRHLGQREATTRNFLLLSFFVLACGAALITVIAARFSWIDWTEGLRQALSGEARGEFQPLMRDVRALAERLAQERERVAGVWSPARLRATLRQFLQGERIVILANREPYMHVKANGGVKAIHPASGLVTALEPVMRACSGVWVAHGSGSADRETVDIRDRVPVPPGEGSYLLRRVWLTEQEENGYYYGLSNEGLWPLCHVAHARPVFRSEDWTHYVNVNRKFANAVCQEVDRDDPIVLVQDYHFALAPRMIRETLPRATIITFWHIPWPNAERIGICPWREELLSGLLGSSVVGFHTQLHCNNFIDSVDAFMESRIDREAQAVVQGGRRTLVRPYPISIEWPVRWLDDAVPIHQARTDVRRELGLAADALLGVGVDRLDYTKGIEERLSAVDELLRRHPEFRGRFTFLQLAAPSRTKIDRYRDLNDRVKALADSINDRWGVGTYRPIVLLQAHHEPAAVFRYYRAADLCYVSSLHDGMNLVAKEFVAARDDEQGVLILSEFTGAARDLTEALVVNPYDLVQASNALALALSMPAEEQRERMRSMRRLVSEFNIYRWAGRMIVDAAELRRKERISGRLSQILTLRASDAP